MIQHQTITVDPAQSNGEKSNPLSSTDNKEFRGYLIDMLADIGKLSLTPEERARHIAMTPQEQAPYIEIINNLPGDATAADLVRAIEQHEAAALGVSVETFTAVSPLLAALRAMTTPDDRYAHLFSGEDVSERKVHFFLPVDGV